MELRFLDGINFEELHRCFLLAFSDYVVTLQPTPDRLLELMTRRGADLSLSVGAFERSNLIGFNLNAVRTYQNELTVYDVATGVVPDFRGSGIAGRLFEMSLPVFLSRGAAKYVLEVIESNQRAIKTYEKAGFSLSRRLDCFTMNQARASGAATIREMEPDWNLFETFKDWNPSWQNSDDSIRHSRDTHIVLGAFFENQVIGYAILYPRTGDVPQFAVHRNFRQRGFGAALLHQISTRTEAGVRPRFMNIDGGARGDHQFLENCGAVQFISQLEMAMKLS